MLQKSYKYHYLFKQCCDIDTCNWIIFFFFYQTLITKFIIHICFNINIAPLLYQSIDKKVMFGYWSSFLPDLAVNPSSSPPTQSLFTTILKDPSPKVSLPQYLKTLLLR